MANWSIETHYFGTLDNTHPHTLLYVLDFSELRAGHPHIINRIDMFGPTLRVQGQGRHAAALKMPNEAWERLRAGIHIEDYHYESNAHHTREIIIVGESVYYEQQELMGDGEDDECGPPFTDFVGRTPEERAFFKQFNAEYHNTRPKNAAEVVRDQVAAWRRDHLK
jgi:hypothetical protein